MNIYEKVQQIKKKILETNIKKSGNNKFANFKYYELSDFVPHIINYCDEAGLLTTFDFSDTEGVLRIINTEKPEEILEYRVPMRRTDLKGCNEVQALGGSITYLKRYLYMNAFDITENDQFDCRITENKEYKCEECGTKFKDFTQEDGKLITAKTQYNQLKKRYKKVLCKKCRDMFDK